MKTDLWKHHIALFFVSVTCLLLVSMFLFLLHALLISTHLMYSLKHKLLKPTSLWFISSSYCRQIGVPLVPAKKVTLQVVLFRKLLYSKTKRCNHDRLLNRCLMSSQFSNDFCTCVFSGKVSVFLQLFEDIQLGHFRLRWAGADRLCLHEVEGNVCQICFMTQFMQLHLIKLMVFMLTSDCIQHFAILTTAAHDVTQVEHFLEKYYQDDTHLGKNHGVFFFFKLDYSTFIQDLCVLWDFRSACGILQF